MKGEVWFTTTDDEGYVRLSENGEKSEAGATTNKTYQEWLDLFSNASEYELTLKAACGEWQMQYSENQDGKYFRSPEERGVPFISASYDNYNQINIGGDVDNSCLPAEIIVTKK